MGTAMKMSAYARAFGLDTDPMAETIHLTCGYRRAVRSAAALALAAWTRTDSPGKPAYLPWPETRLSASLWSHSIVKTALIDTDGGAASLLGFQDQSCLVLLHHPQEPRMRPVPWVFTLRHKPRSDSAPEIRVRRPPGTKFGQAIFALKKPGGSWLLLDERTLSRGLRTATSAVAQLRADTVRIARSALKAVPPIRPSVETLPNEDRPMLDFLPFNGWTNEQSLRADIVAQDVADWLAPHFDPEKFQSLTLTLYARMPEDAGTDPMVEIYLTTKTGVTVRPVEIQPVSRLGQILDIGIAADLINEIGPAKGLAFMGLQKGHRPKAPRIAMAQAETRQSNHRRIDLYARFGAPGIRCDL